MSPKLRLPERPWCQHFPKFAAAAIAAGTLGLIYGADLAELWHGQASIASFQGTLWDVSVDAPAYNEFVSLPPNACVPASSSTMASRSFSVIHVRVPIARFSPVSRRRTVGCESVYGAATWAGPDGVHARYLIKFKYDFRRGACVSSDLFVGDDPRPLELTVQLVEIRQDRLRNHELPWPTELRIAHRAGNAGLSIRETPADPLATNFRRIDSRRNRKFSARLAPGEVTWVASPARNIRGEFLDEIRRHRVRCARGEDCGPIEGIVSVLTDPKILHELRAAEGQGIPVHVITNFQGRFVHEAPSDPAKYQPWQWLRGNPLKYKLTAPMHAKFMAFGRQTVVSTDDNLDRSGYRATRSLAFRYRNADIAAIFHEAAFLLRTSFFYPLSIDRGDEFALLLNADRPRRYAATPSLNARLVYRSDDGIATTAYGFLFHLIRTVPGNLDLFMSPVSDSCWNYGTRLCFYDLLKERADRGLASLSLNGSFYPDAAPVPASAWARIAAKWRGDVVAPALARATSLRQLNELFARSPSGLHIYRVAGEDWGTHHERIGLLGQDWVFAGSANFASATTQNVIEVLRLPELNRQLRAHTRSFDDPYIVVRRRDDSPESNSFGNCEFIYERDVLAKGRAANRDEERPGTLHEAIATFAQAGHPAEIEYPSLPSPGADGTARTPAASPIPREGAFRHAVLREAGEIGSLPAARSFCVKDPVTGRFDARWVDNPRPEAARPRDAAPTR